MTAFKREDPFLMMHPTFGHYNYFNCHITIWHGLVLIERCQIGSIRSITDNQGTKASQVGLGEVMEDIILSHKLCQPRTQCHFCGKVKEYKKKTFADHLHERKQEQIEELTLSSR